MYKIKFTVLNTVFYGTVALCILMTLMPFAFVTHDGPSHLYNSHIINELLFSDNSIYGTYHAINPNWLQPNLSGYFLLCFLQLVVPFLLAEKIFIAFYVLVFCFGFRFYLKQIGAATEWYSLLLFPFVFNAVLFWGFYNFITGVAVSFWLLGYYEKHRFKTGNLHILILLILSLCVYFSHALVFMLNLIYVFVISASEFIRQTKKKEQVIHQIKSVVFLLPGILLFLYYLIQQKSAPLEYEQGYNLLKRFSELWMQMDSIRFTGYSEGTYLQLLYLGFLSLTILKCYAHWRKKENMLTPGFLVLLTFLLINLIMPNTGAGGGIIILRLNFILFLYWMVWISGPSVSIVSKSIIIIFYFISLLLLYSRWEVISCSARQCKIFLETSGDLIPPNTVFSTVHYKPVRGFAGNYQIHSYIDFMSNLDNYLAIKKNALTLHNYEANSITTGSYFPVVWKESKTSEFVWLQTTQNEKIEYFKLAEFEHKWNIKTEILISIGSLEKEEKAKTIWDVENNYTLIKTDDIHFLNIYRLNRDPR